MLRSLRTFFLTAICLLALPNMGRAQSSDHDFELSQQLDIFNNVYALLDLHYVDTLSAKTSINGAIDYLLSTLDPYTVYYPEDRTNELLSFASGRYAGIGVGLRVNNASRRVAVTFVEKDSPAQKAGLRSGDVIVRVDHHDVGAAASLSATDVNQYLHNVAQLLTGEPGSAVDVDVVHAGQTQMRSYTVRRELIESKSVVYAAMVSDSIGYVCLSRYSENTAQELRGALVTLIQRGAQKFILDLRDNPGGLLRAAVDVVSLFLPKDTEVLRTRGKEQVREEILYTKSDPIDELLPLVVLVDGGTASAAEITAGALQDYDRAVIMGRRTYGKGLVQSTYDLPFGGLLKLTSGKFYIPSGRCIQALDYTHRTPSGDPVPLPDSLAHPFQTSTGRLVYDGGGIQPDVALPADTISSLIAALQKSDVLYDFVAIYLQTHRITSAPLQFHITDDDFVAFKLAVLNSGFEYGTQTLQALQRLREAAQLEGYDAAIDTEIANLQPLLTPDLSAVLERQREPVTRLLESTILRAYYGEAGQTEYGLRNDMDVAYAIALLRQDQRYHSILTTVPER